MGETAKPAIVMVGVLNHDRVILVGPYERHGDKYADEVLFAFYAPVPPLKELPEKLSVTQGLMPYTYERVNYKDLRMDFKGNIYVHKTAIGYDKLQEAIRLIAAFEGWERVPKPETALGRGLITLWVPDKEGVPVLATGPRYAAWIAPRVVV